MYLQRIEEENQIKALKKEHETRARTEGRNAVAKMG
jgi:hypothetical protein